MQYFVEKCVAWNSARYDRELDEDLAIALLNEEYLELAGSRTIIDALDAIGDILFVAVGVLWKSGIPSAVITNFMMELCYSKKINENIDAFLVYDVRELVNSFGFLHTCRPELVRVFCKCVAQAIIACYANGYSNYLEDICNAIAASNDTKEIKGKTPSNVKANVTKGANYVPPTETLKEIVNARNSH